METRELVKRFIDIEPYNIGDCEYSQKFNSLRTDVRRSQTRISTYQELLKELTRIHKNLGKKESNIETISLIKGIEEPTYTDIFVMLIKHVAPIHMQDIARTRVYDLVDLLSDGTNLHSNLLTILISAIPVYELVRAIGRRVEELKESKERRIDDAIKLITQDQNDNN